MKVLLKSKRGSNLDEKMSRMLEINIEQEMVKKLVPLVGKIF